MRRRITFLRHRDLEQDAENVNVTADFVDIQDLQAAREDRITTNLYELPPEALHIVKQVQELHIRWSSSHPLLSIYPFASIISPGFHISYTPIKRHKVDGLCDGLIKTFGIDINCTAFQVANSSWYPKAFGYAHNLQSSFTQHHSQFVASPTSYLYRLRPTIQPLAKYIEKLCPTDGQKCRSDVRRLAYADSIDIDFDAVSNSLSLSAYFQEPVVSDSLDHRRTWNERIENYGEHTATEIGILQSERSTEPQELSLGGKLIVVGKDAKPKPTLFSFPSRHLLTSSNPSSAFSTDFLEPTGSHPILRLSFTSGSVKPYASCGLHAYFTLPSAVFVDRYQLSSPNLLASKNIRGIRSVSGETDLEVPEWAVKRWGSNILLELSPPLTGTDAWSADVPLHLRYVRPSRGDDPQQSCNQADISVAWPVVFWACPTDVDGKLSVNPFDRKDLGYDTLFAPRTQFYHFQPHGNNTRLAKISVPVLNLGQANLIERLSIVGIIGGFLWVCMTLWRSKFRKGSKAPSAASKKDQ